MMKACVWQKILFRLPHWNSASHAHLVIHTPYELWIPGFISHTTHECLIKIVSNIIFCQNAHLKFSQKCFPVIMHWLPREQRRGGRKCPSMGSLLCVCVCVCVCGFCYPRYFCWKGRGDWQCLCWNSLFLLHALITEAATIRSTLCLADTW